MFAGVLGTEVAETKTAGPADAPAASSAAAIGYGVFLLLHETGFVNFLHLPAGAELHLLGRLPHGPLALIGLVLALLTGVFHEGLGRRSSAASRTGWSCGR